MNKVKYVQIFCLNNLQGSDNYTEDITDSDDFKEEDESKNFQKFYKFD